MEGEHDKNHQAPQVPESQTGRSVADFLDLTAIGPRETVCRAKLELTRRPTHPDIWRRDVSRRTGDSALASDGRSAAPTWIIVARGFDHGDLIMSDRLTEPRSLMQELIVAARQER
jgi:hypothetical protein